MEENKHWATRLEVGDRCSATIRHATDGSKNLIDVPVIICHNYRRESKVDVAFQGNTYTIPYMELREPNPIQ